MNKYNGLGGKVIIPETIENYPVTLIEQSTFENNDKKLNSITHLISFNFFFNNVKFQKIKSLFYYNIFIK